jgi:hypothetical protein
LVISHGKMRKTSAQRVLKSKYKLLWGDIAKSYEILKAKG